MFTAPHGLELYRYKRVAGGATKRILHRREIHTTELARLSFPSFTVHHERAQGQASQDK